MGRARTRENFPRMKVRGGRRRRDAELIRAWRGVGGAAGFGDALAAVGRAALEAAEVIARVATMWVDSIERIAKAARQAACVTWWVAGQNGRNRWVATHQLPAHPSPWAAPITKETP